MKYFVLFWFMLGCSNQSVPTSSGFSVSTVISNLDVPWDIAWGPDNQIWCTEQDGLVSKVDPQSGKKTLLLTIPDVYRYNLGLLSMVIHPEFKQHPYVFFQYTYLFPDSTIRCKVVRYEFVNNSLSAPQKLIDIEAGRGHNGARMVIDSNGKLFIATGDVDSRNDDKNGGNAQDIKTTGGKILRINIDGSIPDDNPYPGNPVWARGLRVPQGLAISAGGLIYSSEHGNDEDDEINLITKNANFGYPYVRGKCDDSTEKQFCLQNKIVEPIKAWTPTIAPAGMDFYSSASISEWKNSLLLVSLKGQSLRVLKLSDHGTQVVDERVYLEKRYGRLRDVCVSPQGDVFISTSNRDWNPAPGFPVSSDDRILKISPSTSADSEYIPVQTKEMGEQRVKDSGEVLYNNYCSSCHKPDGEGMRGVFPALTASKLLTNRNDQLIRKVVFGDDVADQSSKVYGQKMTGFQFLSNEDLAGIINYIKKQFAYSDDAISAGKIEELKKRKSAR